MLDSRLLCPMIAQYGLVRQLLLVTHLFLVLISFSFVTECTAASLASRHLCLSHFVTSHEHQDADQQLAAILPLKLEQAPLRFERLDILTDLLPTSTLLYIIKPPPRFS